jgi:DNA-damage-inducible protein J
MATTVTIQAKVKPELKEQAEAIFDAMGMGLGDAIRIFLQQTVNDGGLPFTPSPKRPNAETLAAMNEIDRGEGKRFKTIKELFADLEDDDAA